MKKKMETTIVYWGYLGCIYIEWHGSGCSSHVLDKKLPVHSLNSCRNLTAYTLHLKPENLN